MLNNFKIQNFNKYIIEGNIGDEYKLCLMNHLVYNI